MVATRRRGRNDAEVDEDEQAVEVPRTQEVASDSSDDEAPEEVTLDRGKQDAAKLRKQELEAKKKATQEAKDRRKRRGEAQAADKAAGGAAAAAATVEEEEGEGDDALGDDIDMLPEDVIAAMAETEAQDKRFMERRVISEQLRVRKPKKQRRTFKDRQVGPVTVQVLNKGSQRKPSEAAIAFLEERLRGGVKRSNEMLRATKIGGVFVTGPRAP